MEILLAAITDAIFAIIADDFSQNPVFEKLRDKLKGPSPEKLAFQKALISAFFAFSKKYPELHSSLFDEHFIQKPEVITELSKTLTPNLNPDLEVLDQAWQSQFSTTARENILEPLRYFISTLVDEVKKQPQLQPFVDSRALEQLYKISDQTNIQTNLQEQIRDILHEIKLVMQQNNRKDVEETFSSKTDRLLSNDGLELSKDAIDFVIITALDEERDAVLNKLPNYSRVPPSNEDIRVYYGSKLNTVFSDGSQAIYNIIVMPLLGIGRVHAATATSDAIRRWHPRYMILVGIAGGVSDKDVKLGDIIVSDQIVDYELQKLTKIGPQLRWEVYRAAPELIGASKNFDIRNVQRYVSVKRPSKGLSQLHVGPIASGDKVIAVKEAFDKYRDKWPMLLGVEMEAAGAATAAFQSKEAPGFFMIRGVSDLADENKNIKSVRKWRKYACDIAASYLMALLSAGPVNPITGFLSEPNPRVSVLPRNLPEKGMSFLGRDAEILEITNTLDNVNCRLISLVGPGGIGKTSLAIEIAKITTDRFKNGVVFIPLASVTSAEFLLSSIAESAQIAIVASKDIFSQITDYLKDRVALLILDNFDHLVSDGAEIINQFLHSTSDNVKILVTSRERLNISDEWVIEMDGLDFPALMKYSMDSLMNYPAIQLFANSAQKADLDFRIDENNAADVVKICELVQGLPLGIELAANWIRLLDCKGIAREIERNMDFLRNNTRFATLRHQSLRAVFEQSWSLLSDAEQKILSKLSVFRGGFDLKAAASIADADINILASILDKSLVKMDGGRYEILEVIKQYSQEKLSDDPETYALTKDKHCNYYLKLLADNKVDLKTEQQNDVVQLLSKEIGNIRDAWLWAIEQTNYQLLNTAIESLFLYYHHRGAIEDADSLVGRATSHFPNSSLDINGVLGRLLRFQARLSHILAKYQLAIEYYRESLSILRKQEPSSENLKEISVVLDGIGSISYTLGQYVDAREYFLESARISEDLADNELMASTYLRLGDIASVLGNNQDAKQFLEKSLTLWEKINHPRRLALCLCNLADAECKLGSYDQAEYLLKRSLDMFTSLDDDIGCGIAEINLGRVYFIRENFVEAENFCQSGLRRFKEINHYWGIPFALNHLAKGLIRLGKLDRALELSFESVDNCRKYDNPWNLAFANINIGNIYLAKGMTEIAEDTFFHVIRLSSQAQATPLLLEALLGISLIFREQGKTAKSVEFLDFITKCPVGDAETRKYAQQLLNRPEQDGDLRDNELSAEDWQPKLVVIRKELEILSGKNYQT